MMPADPFTRHIRLRGIPTVALKSAIDRLTALRKPGVRAWRSLRSTRQRIEAAVAFVAAVACVVAAGIQVGPALAETKIEGEPVPADMLPAIVVGATSCPALTGPRLAAQLMAASEFETTAKSGDGEGLAGLDAAEWKKWAPWQQAQRTDVLANVLALAHRTCKYVGQVRDAGVEDDQWGAAVAAEHVGLSAVLKAKGVPTSAEKQVETVTGYANWYADQPEFTGAEKKAEPEASAKTTEAGVAIPDAYVDPIIKAGRTCPGILPAPRVAAQLMAMSAFNPNLRGPNGGQGIAQFTESMWQRYRPSPRASVWDPNAAIPAMSSAICDLKNQLSTMRTADRSGDAYTLALAAYQWGVTAVRAEGGVPRSASVVQLSDLVTGYVPHYSADTRLDPPKPKPKPSPSKSEEPKKPEPEKTTKAPAPKPTKKSTWNPDDSWEIVNALNGKLIEVPGDDNNTAAGTTIQLWDNQTGKDRLWHIADADEDGWVTITNGFAGKALGIRDGSNDNGAELVMLDPKAGGHNQQWRLRDAGDGKHFIVNRSSGKALDILGDDCCADNGTAINQWDLQEHAVDQHWTLRK
jgi:hypothetical protein